MPEYRISEKVYIAKDLIIIDEVNDKGRVRIGNRVAMTGWAVPVVSSNPNASQTHHSHRTYTYTLR